MQSYSTSIASPVFSTFLGDPNARRCNLYLSILQPICSTSPHRRKVRSLSLDVQKLRVCARKWTLLGKLSVKDDEILTSKGRRGGMQVARANRGFNFNFGGDNNTRRVLGNLALAVGLTYLTMTDQLGWILDAVVSLWLIVLILPVLGLGAFLWFAGRDIVQDRCPNCGNEFQILKSSLKEGGVQLCPYCAQPFSVQGKTFARESTKFYSDRSSSFGQVFGGFSGKKAQEKSSVGTIVDIEAEVKDVD